MTSSPRAPRRDPIRSNGRRRHPDLVRAELERTRLLDELDTVDTELSALATRRCAIARRLAELREALWPADRYRRGRQPGELGVTDLPPLPDDPVWLYGRRLRSVCLALLRRTGRLGLRDLHALLHAHGYGIDSNHAVKALADAMAYEVDARRAIRVRRGEYECTGPAPRRGRHGAPDDRLLDEVLAPLTAA